MNERDLGRAFVLANGGRLPKSKARAPALKHVAGAPAPESIWLEHRDSRQATKLDLIDVARALGLDASARNSVPDLRAIIRLRLLTIAKETRLATRQPALPGTEV